ncbi:DUF1800 domain-containing protein [Massilia horti]|uniref:DUF1800 domain-containing protein n=1 Tax=Massilia horti TaxID=2562153 RepID=A0A4Y9SY13_9BURK|nr:DUF1800 domain-containing protein [Massilia horti]TFW31322.1 DUF1800 domain-containing protein [Massilia horti]
MLSSAALLTACGGGGGGAAPAVGGPVAGGGNNGGPVAGAITDADASRFLAQASMGANRDQIARVKALGYDGWLEEQFGLAPSISRWDWLVAAGYSDVANRNSEAGFDACAWRKLIASPDTLRQRITLALSEIVVVGIDGLVGAGWKQFTGAAYLDLLETNAFGNYRTLLQAVSQSAAMGEFLTFRGNTKFDPKTGAMPDENYARELMQLFSIGLVQLNLDGTAKSANGQPQETYGLDDITGLARVFTGWDYDMAGGNFNNAPDFKRRPMTQIASRHETGSKTFLGSNIGGGGDGASDLKAALDIIFAHPNVGPFIGKQLIQRLVCSNPTPAYVARVASVFNNDGKGVRGDLKAVIKAILLDDEARNPAVAAGPAFGKQREPILRFVAWARAFNAASASDAWNIGNTSDAATRLGQSPLRSPSVFNFFRPGYVPPNSAIASAGLVAPEFQLTNESSTVGYINYMQTAVSRGVGDVKADYSKLLPLADNAGALLDELNTVLAAGQLQSATLTILRTALDSMPTGSDTVRLNRIYAALVLVLAAPEFTILH